LNRGWGTTGLTASLKEQAEAAMAKAAAAKAAAERAAAKAAKKVRACVYVCVEAVRGICMVVVCVRT
jgi:hypothetical protein